MSVIVITTVFKVFSIHLYLSLSTIITVCHADYEYVNVYHHKV